MPDMERSRWLTALLALALTQMLTLAACSPDGSGPGGSGGPGGDGGGIGGSGVSIGSIDGFGSVILNGRRFATDDARFVVGGEGSDQSSLRIGMLVRADVDFSSSTASSVVYDATLRGSLESIDAAGRRATVLRQPIVFDASTLFEDVDPSELGTGTFIEVSGPRDAAGAVIAGFVRRGAAGEPLQVGGIITAVDVAAMRFRLGGLEVDYAGADLSSLDGPVVDGRSVIVTAPAGAFDAAAMRLAAAVVRPGTGSGLVAQTSVELEGIVTAIDDPTSIAVNEQPVRTDDATAYAFPDGAAATPASVALNARVEVGGRIDANGVLVAERVVIVPPEESRLIGRIERLDPVSRTLELLGVTAGFTERTRLTGEDDPRGGFEGLREGMYVRVDAAFFADTLIAARIDVQDADEEARLRGPVTGVDRATGTFAILGVPIIDGEDTDYELSNGAEVRRDAFLQQIEPGDIVTARWREYRSTTLPPDDVEVELD